MTFGDPSRAEFSVTVAPLGVPLMAMRPGYVPIRSGARPNRYPGCIHQNLETGM
jgi:hypothetical protein